MQNLIPTKVIYLLIGCFFSLVPLSYSNIVYSFPPPVEKRKPGLRKINKKKKSKAIWGKKRKVHKKGKLSISHWLSEATLISLLVVLVAGAFLFFFGYVILGAILIGLVSFAFILFSFLVKLGVMTKKDVLIALMYSLLYLPISFLIGLFFLIYGLIIALPLFWILGLIMIVLNILFLLIIMHIKNPKL